MGHDQLHVLAAGGGKLVLTNHPTPSAAKILRWRSNSPLGYQSMHCIRLRIYRSDKETHPESAGIRSVEENRGT